MTSSCLWARIYNSRWIGQALFKLMDCCPLAANQCLTQCLLNSVFNIIKINPYEMEPVSNTIIVSQKMFTERHCVSTWSCDKMVWIMRFTFRACNAYWICVKLVWLQKWSQCFVLSLCDNCGFMANIFTVIAPLWKVSWPKSLRAWLVEFGGKIRFGSKFNWARPSRRRHFVTSACEITPNHKQICARWHWREINDVIVTPRVKWDAHFGMSFTNFANLPLIGPRYRCYMRCEVVVKS